MYNHVYSFMLPAIIPIFLSYVTNNTWTLLTWVMLSLYCSQHLSLNILMYITLQILKMSYSNSVYFLHGFQQLSGIIVVIYFGEKIFSAANISSPTLCTVIVGSVQILSTFFSGIVVDRLGRKILLFVSGVDITICLITLGYYFWLQEHNISAASAIKWLPLISVIVYIIGYGMGFGPVPWVLLGELLGPEIKNFAFGIACVVSLCCESLVAFTFHGLIRSLGAATTFWIYSTPCVLATVFVFLLPETKNKTLQEIQEKLACKRAQNDETSQGSIE